MASLDRLRTGWERRATDIDEATPGYRNRFVDFLRVFAICAVVVGHWLVVAITFEQGRLGGANLLAAAGWTHWLTWLFQVMPLFFIVGGYANSMSWTTHRKRGGNWGGWLYRRLERLLRPTTVYVGIVLLVTFLARVSGTDPATLDEAGWLVAIHLWFLVAYLGVVTLTPVAFAAHERWGGLAAATLAAGVVAVDFARLVLDAPYVGDLNYALLWLAIHQLGFLWRDGRLAQVEQRSWKLVLAGLVLLIFLTTVGPYPVSMVNVPGAGLQNAAPPSVVLLPLTALQFGLALMLKRSLTSWLYRPHPWAAVVVLNHVVMTVFLWHLIPVVVVGAALYPTGLMPQPGVGTLAWFALRPLWIVVLACVLVPLVAVAARSEHIASRVRRGAMVPWGRGLVCIGAVIAVAAGLALLTVRGFDTAGPTEAPGLGATLYLAGAVLFWLNRSLGRDPAPDDHQQRRGS